MFPVAIKVHYAIIIPCLSVSESKFVAVAASSVATLYTSDDFFNVIFWKGSPIHEAGKYSDMQSSSKCRN